MNPYKSITCRDFFFDKITTSVLCTST
jgi:hypothetical protein